MDNLGLSSPATGALALATAFRRSVTVSCQSFEGLRDSLVNFQTFRKNNNNLLGRR